MNPLKNKVQQIILLFGLMIFPLSAHAQDRKTINLNEGWSIYPAWNVAKSVEKTKVTLPHTWNVDDVFGKVNYSRESMFYKRELSIDQAFAGKRLFLYFEGVNSVASVYLNGNLVGEHVGGYTAFCYEITKYVVPGKVADLSVLVSNSYRTDVLPLSGDFNVYGGIHRPVHLIVTDKDCISPLDYASSGVYIKPLTVSKESAKFEIVTKLSVEATGKKLQLHTSIFDADNKLLTQLTSDISSKESRELVQKFSIDKPILWNGKQNPYCYQVKVELLADNSVIDEVIQKTGFRYFKVDSENGFYLNGKYLDLYGFGRHEDVAGKGSALIVADYDRDMDLILESGATAMRLTHYPHGKHMYELSDKNGIVLSTEIPFVGPGGYTGPSYAQSEQLERNVKTMLVEMIRQNYNHPSIFFWGIENELKLDFDNPVPFVKQLSKLANEEDASRLTTCASFGVQEDFIGSTNVMGWNEYFGWYGGMPSDMGPFLDKMKLKAKSTPICITEYGAGGSVSTHQWPVQKPIPGGTFHPEEWQTIFHEGNWKELSTRKFVWAKFIWNFADFGSSIRNEGDKQGINDKGLITYDRSIKKDAFYFYKANWNPQPMLYISSRRYINRTNAVTDLKVFTNAPTAELFINGKSVGSMKADNQRTIVWKNVTLNSDDNKIEVKAKSGNVLLTDTCLWTLSQH